MGGCNYINLSPADVKTLDSSVVNDDNSHRASVLNVRYPQALRSDDVFVYVTPGSTPFTVEPRSAG